MGTRSLARVPGASNGAGVPRNRGAPKRERCAASATSTPSRRSRVTLRVPAWASPTGPGASWSWTVLTTVVTVG